MSDTATLVTRAIEEKRELSLPNGAFDELVRRYQDMMYGYVYARVLDPYLAQDIVQDSFISAYSNLESIRNPEAFGAWIKSIAVHQCARHLNIRSRTRRAMIAESIDELPSRYDDPAQSFERNEQRSEIESAINGLSETNRAAFVLYYLGGHSHREIADVLGLSVDAVKKRVQRSRDALKKEMVYMIREHMDLGRPSDDPGVLKRISLAASFEQAASLGQLCLIEAMLADGVDVNEPDAKGRTLLHWAASNGHIDAVQLLLRCGADVTQKDTNGRTPGDSAKERGHASIARMLEAHIDGNS